MRSPEVIAAAVIRTWTRTYTSRLDPSVRDERRAEIESDLWEHANAAGRTAADRRSVAGQMLARCLLGIAADLSWRAQMAAGFGRPGKKGVPMNERLKNDWWIPAPLLLIGFGAFTALILIVGDGYESPWSRTGTGWNPTSVQRYGNVAMGSIVFVVLPIWALLLRRSHPGWTFTMLTPVIFLSMSFLAWDSPAWIYVIPALGLVTLVGALVNAAQRSVEAGPALSGSSTRAPGA